MNTPLVDRDLVAEMIDYALHEAPKHITDLYLGLDDTEISEVITDTLARLQDITLPHEPEEPSMADIGRSKAVVTKYAGYVSYLHNVLPLFAQKAWERHQREMEYESRFITGGKLPSHSLSMVDESPLPGEPVNEDTEWTF